MKKFVTLMTIVCMAVSLTACSNSALESAQTAVDTYNQAAENFNEQIADYNSAVQVISDETAELEAAIDSAQESINKGETPYDEETLTALKSAMSEASDGKSAVPEAIESYEALSVDEDAKTADLKSLAEEAETLTAEIEAYEIPATPDIPDYTEFVEQLTTAQEAYEDSIQSLKQVTAPSDDFVIERLQTIETITEIDAVTEDHDPNGKLNKQGGYIGCIYFADSQVDKDNLYIEEGGDNVIDIGCDGGGAVEIFSSVEDAETRDAYLGAFDGTGYASGSHYVVGTVLIRTSDELNGTQQLELTDAITQALLKVQH